MDNAVRAFLSLPVYLRSRSNIVRPAWRRAQKWILCLVTGFIALCTSSRAQTSYLYAWVPQPYSNKTPVEYGYVEQANGHLHLEIPLGEARQNRSGSGATQVRLVYDSNFWYPDNFGTTSYSWLAGTTWHLLPNFTDYSWSFDSAGTEVISATDQEGVEHNFPCFDGCYSEEGQGYWVDKWGVYAPNGSDVVNFYTVGFGGKATTTDSNGNYVALESGYNLPQVNGQQGEAEYFDTSNISFFQYSEANFSDQSIGTSGPAHDDLFTLTNMSSAGATASYVAHEVYIQVNTNFNSERVAVAQCPSVNSTPCYAQVISQIVLPDQTSFTFKYDCDPTVAGQESYCNSPSGQSAYYGGLTEMVTPQGGVYQYSYVPFTDSYGDASLILHSRSNGSGSWSYSQSAKPLSCSSATAVGCTQTMTTVEPNGRTTTTTNTMNNGAWPTSVLVTDASGNKQSLTTTQWDFSHSNAYLGYAAAYIQKQWETVTVWDSTGAAETKKTAYSYDSPQTGNVTALQEWGYLSGTSPSFPSIADVTTYTAYYTPTNSPITDSTESNITKGGINVINKPRSITVCNNSGSDSACTGGGTRVSQQIISYDQYGGSGPASVTGVTNHDDQSYGGSQLVRGNPTSISSWVANSQYVTKSISYDTTGQVTSTIDGNDNTTTYSYADSYYVDNGTSSPSAYTPSAPTHAYATTVTLPTVHGKSYSTTSGYYYGNQKPAFQKDSNGNGIYYHYSDSLDRVTQVVYPLGWTLSQYTSQVRTDVYQGEAVTGTTPSSLCTGCLHTATLFDSLGRVTETIAADGSKVDTSYNSMGLVQSISNRYFAISDSTYGATTYAYDVLGRLCMQNNPDNVPAQSATCSSKGSSALQFTYVVNGGSKTDENGNTWKYLNDPLNRLASVTEPNGTVTQYTYDVVGNLLSVSQPLRSRSFTYDGLSRLVTASNPESGSICYGTLSGSTCTGSYDGNGNVLSKRDARGVVTSYTYDAWNRLTSKGYSDGATPISCYQYDASGITDSVGHLTSEWTQPAGTTCTGSQQSGYAPVAGQYLTLRAITAYDAMGRKTSEQQCTPANCIGTTYYSLGYGYDLAGNLTSLTNSATTVPGGTNSLALTYSYDSGGRQNSLSSNWQDATHPATLFNAQSFYPQGAWQNATYGMNLNLVRSFDNRFRIFSETDTGSAPGSATGSSATVTISGSEQVQ